MNTAVTQLAVYSLLLSALYLAKVTRTEMRHSRVEAARREALPRDASLVGVDSTGRVRRPMGDSERRLANKGHVLLFVLHNRDVANEVRFWNAVSAKIGSSPDLSVELWGICDNGHGCDASQKEARFTVIGYLDPHQMHAMAIAESAGNSLLYGSENMLKAEIPRAGDPEAVASSIKAATTGS